MNFNKERPNSPESGKITWRDFSDAALDSGNVELATIAEDGTVILPPSKQKMLTGAAPSDREKAQVTLFDLADADNPALVTGEDGVQRDESKNLRAREAFRIYLGLGTIRTLAKLASYLFYNKVDGWRDMTYPSILSKVREYARLYGWANRAKIFTAAQSAKAIQQVNAAAARRRDRRVRISDKMLTIAENLMEKSGLTDEEGLATLSQADALLLLPYALKFAQAGMEADKKETDSFTAKVKPPKPIDQMDESELDAFIAQLHAESGELPPDE